MVEVTEAERIFQRNVRLHPPTECPLAEAEGRVLREDIRADRDQPPYHRVAMDGIALSTAAVSQGVQAFRHAGTQGAGHPPLDLPSTDAYVEVMTGGVLPGECDTVVRIEDVERNGDTASLRLATPPSVMGNVHPKGSDCMAGDVLVEAGRRLSSPHIAIAASMGLTTLQVSALPRAAIISTGDELVAVDAPVKDYQVRRSNVHALHAAFRGGGFGEADLFHLDDDKESLRRELSRILDAFDVVILSGGVSMGRFDYVPEVLSDLNVENHIYKIRQRPGKPLWFGTREGKPVFALP